MKYYTYILLCSDKKFYVGFSSNLKQRLQEHAAGRARSTKNRRPFKLIHYEYFINNKDAKAREIYLKSGAGHQQFKQILKNTLTVL